MIVFIQRLGGIVTNMTVSINNFSPEKALAALMYLVRHTTDNMYVVMKMLYVVDKIHLEKTGRFMAGDYYVAMGKGATPSGTYDIVKFVRGDGIYDCGFPKAKDFFSIDCESNRIALKRDVPEQHLSEIARTCLDAVIREYSANSNSGHWFRRAHDSAWSKTRALHPFSKAPDMSDERIAATLPNSNEVLGALSEQG